MESCTPPDASGTPCPEQPRPPTSFLLITSSYLPVVGGSEIEAQRVCAALRARKHRVLILCPGGPPMPPVADWIDPAGLPVRILGNRWPPPWRGYAFALGAAWTLIRRVRSYQVAYFLMPGLQVALGVPVAAALGKRIIMKFSGANEVRKLTRSRIGRLQLRALRRWAARIMILNPLMADEAVESGLDRSRLLWMPNPVDVSAFAPLAPEARLPLRRALGLDTAGVLILFVGRLAPEKELASLVRAFANVLAEQPDSRLVLVGGGPCRDSLDALARHLGIAARVTFAGQVDPAAVRRFLQCADIFALVSSLEGFPVSLLEALAVGLPSVVSNIPANTQLVRTEQNGLVAELRDERSIARALGRLAADPRMRARLGAAARQGVVDQYSTDRIVQLYENLFAALDRPC